MLFGEIVEPSTRAYIDDDFQDYPETETKPKYKGNVECPREIDNLIFIDSKPAISIIKQCLLNSVEPYMIIENGKICIYGINNTFYVMYESSYTTENLLSFGQLVEILSEWLQKSKKIYAITSLPSAAYQNNFLKEKLDCIVRVLTTGSSDTFEYTSLEVPNLVTGLGASVLSYCKFSDLLCTFFILYFDDSSLISYSNHPLINLFKKLSIQVNDCDIKKILTPSSNLYM